MTLSILHRITGVALSFGLVMFVFWLEAIAYDAVPYEAVMEFLGSLLGQFMLLGWCFSFFFHLSNGIRHLIWDTGHMLDKRQADASAWFVIVAAVVMSSGYWFLV
jgi:succinate dehydrogenase / fumarate reductase cytochrome b subunit